ADVVPFKGREAFEIAADDGGKVHGADVAADLGDGRREVHHGIVLGGHRGVAGGAARDDVHIQRDLFAGLHGDVLHFAIFQDHVAAFVERKGGGEFVPILGDENLDAGVSEGLLIVRSEKDDIAI